MTDWIAWTPKKTKKKTYHKRIIHFSVTRIASFSLVTKPTTPIISTACSAIVPYMRWDRIAEGTIPIRKRDLRTAVNACSLTLGITTIKYLQDIPTSSK